VLHTYPDGIKAYGHERITTDFCSRSHARIDAAVTQGLGILAGLALGSSVQGQEIGK
jgi:hypothetical protein